MSNPLRPHELDYLPELAQTHVHWIGDAIQLSHPLSPSSRLRLNLSQHQVFSNESTLPILWPKYCSFSISPSKEYSECISFSINWSSCFQRTLKSLLQHHNLKAPILQYSGFFMVQFSHLYITTGKLTALIIWTFVSKLMSLLSNTLPGFFIAFLPREKVSFNFMAAVTICRDFGDKETEIWHCFHFFSHLFAMKRWDRCHDLHFMKWRWVSSHIFLSPLSLSSRSSLVPCKFLPLKWYHLHI